MDLHLSNCPAKCLGAEGPSPSPEAERCADRGHKRVGQLAAACEVRRIGDSRATGTDCHSCRGAGSDDYAVAAAAEQREFVSSIVFAAIVVCTPAPRTRTRPRRPDGSISLVLERLALGCGARTRPGRRGRTARRRWVPRRRRRRCTRLGGRGAEARRGRQGAPRERKGACRNAQHRPARSADIRLDSRDPRRQIWSWCSVGVSLAGIVGILRVSHLVALQNLKGTP